MTELELVIEWLIIDLDFLRSESKGRSFFSREYPRHPAVFVNAHSKGVTGVTVCKFRIQRSCGDRIFVT